MGLYTVSVLQQMRSLRDVYYTHEFQEMRVWNDYIEEGDKRTSDHGVVCARFLYDPQ